jgi:hypothetical protein
MLFGLQDLQSAQPDPSELVIKCNKLGVNTHHCMVTWLDGSASCYTCSGGRCAKSGC